MNARGVTVKMLKMNRDDDAMVMIVMEITLMAVLAGLRALLIQLSHRQDAQALG